MKNKNNKANSRRSFLRKGLTAGMAAIAGGTVLHAYGKVQSGGEKSKVLTPEGKLVEVDKEQLQYAPDKPIRDMDIRKGIKGRRFVMVIDLRRCRNNGSCMTACAKMHSIPEYRSFIKVKKMQDAETTHPYWMPTLCFHCDNSPCVKVCPVGATFKRTDGIVAIDSERCMGCRYCMVACPYSSRSYVWGKESIKSHNGDHDCPAPTRGTVQKCDFCPQQAAKGELPGCVTACPNGAIYFGDEYEDAVSNGQETVRLSTMLRDLSAYRFREDFGTKPRVYYVKPVNRRFPFEEESS